MKRFLVLLPIALLLLSSCHSIIGSGNIISQNRETGKFSKISVSAGIDVELSQGTTTEVNVEADDNVIRFISADVSGDELTIGLNGHYSFSNCHMKVYVTSPMISGIRTSGGSQVNIKGVLKSDNSISCKASNGSTIEGEFDAPDVSASASGGATVEISGRTKNLNVSASNGSSVKAEDLRSENVTVEASGGATANVQASYNIDAKAHNGASINYYGEAAVVKKVSGGGSVEKRD
ncbi:MAG TPA: head GIN domain-containing protein [Ferruginibacter sp.]|nr:head GIN domain-containing protein [Ferruginibacter sp.]